jgi:UDP-N-acetylglucosamine transferase subunit ALG13
VKHLDVAATGGPTVFATVGTDHHQFARLIRWVDGWVDANAHRGVTGFIQIGTSPAPRRARSAAYLGYDEMEQAMRSARAVVTHGGPGSIMLCSSLGKTPIVIPRQASLDEHVDDHQVRFAERLAEARTIALARTESQLHELLSEAGAGGTNGAAAPAQRHVDQAVRRFEELVDELVRDGGRSAWSAGGRLRKAA